ncbi:MAG: alpha-L-fucosidase [Clostridia bacterium]|nr:alpha-L-fucosidase [Clostridia bacterium]
MYQKLDLPEKWQWFQQARFGMFIHWGPYAAIGRGEQALFRDHMDPVAYERQACLWDPASFDARRWARLAKAAGMRYACLTARHHDGYCLWDSDLTDYTSAKQAPKRDFVREYTEAFRAEGLRVGLYYSWLDWRVPAYFEGPGKNPEGFAAMKAYMHGQVEELLTRYGQIDHFFFDGAWPRTREELGSEALLEKMRVWQPGILVNNRLGRSEAPGVNAEDTGHSRELGDFGTPELNVTAEKRLWEACHVTTWRLWGYAPGKQVKPPEQLLDLLCECAEKGGNLLMNVAPDGDGEIPPAVAANLCAMGRWLEVNGEAVYGTDNGDITEFLTHGRQTARGNTLYLIIRFWEGRDTLRVNDLLSRVQRVTLLATGQELPFEQTESDLLIHGLPAERPCPLFPVIRVDCAEPLRTNDWGLWRNWQGDPQRIADWARQRGETPAAGSAGFHSASRAENGLHRA